MSKEFLNSVGFQAIDKLLGENLYEVRENSNKVEEILNQYISSIETPNDWFLVRITLLSYQWRTWSEFQSENENNYKECQKILDEDKRFEMHRKNEWNHFENYKKSLGEDIKYLDD